MDATFQRINPLWKRTKTWGGGEGDCNIEFKNIRRYVLSLAVIQGRDGGIEHSVVLYKGLIFDAMEEHALPLNLENLNRCGGPLGFLKFHRVHDYEKSPE